MPTITISFSLPDDSAVIELVKSLQADLAFLTKGSTTLAEHPRLASVPLAAQQQPPRQLVLPMVPKAIPRRNQARGALITHPATHLLMTRKHQDLLDAIPGHTTIANVRALLDHLAATYGMEPFKVSGTQLASKLGYTEAMVKHTLCAMHKAGILKWHKVNGSRARLIDWVG